MLTSASEFCQRFKLIRRKINSLRLTISILILLEHLKLFYSPFLLFRACSLQNFWSVKLAAISRETANIIVCSSQTCCLSVMNKKAIFQGLMMKYLQSFEFKLQKGKILKSAEKLICFTVFLMELLTNYVGVIVPNFKLFDLAELVLRLFIENASKSH